MKETAEESKKATCSRTSVPSESSWSVLNETTPKKLTRSNRVKVYVKEQLAKLEDVKTGLVGREFLLINLTKNLFKSISYSQSCAQSLD